MRRPCLPLIVTMTAVLALLSGVASAQPGKPTAATAAAAKVGVRSGVHPTYTRLVFDWTSNTAYTAEQSGQDVTVRFPVTAEVNLAPVLRARPTRVEGLTQAVEGGALLVRFRIPAGAGIKDMRAGTRVVIDILDKAPAAPAKPAPAAESTPAATKPAPAPEKAESKEKPPATTTAKAEIQEKPPAPVDPRRAKEGAPLFELRGRPAPAEGEAAAKGQPTPLTPAPAAGQPAPGDGSMPPAPAASPAPVPAVEQAALAPAPLVDSVSIPFDPKLGTAAAVFERAGYLYVLFDRPVPPETAPAPGSVPGLNTAVEPVTVPDAAGFRLPMPALMQARVQRDGTIWRIGLNRATDLPPNDPATVLTATPDPQFALGARLVVAAPDVAKVLSFKDPVVGDTLFVTPLSTPGPHLPTAQRFAQAQLLPSLQGLVVRPLDDRLVVQPVREGVEISVPGGLSLSPAADLASVAPPPVPKQEKEKLFDFKRWGQVPAERYLAARQERWQHLVELPDAERNRGRLDLARFYIANGLSYEAGGMLTRVQEVQPDVDRRPEFLAVRGIARVLNGNLDGALADLSNPGLAGEKDADLWRAAALAGKQDYAGAHALFQARKDQLAAYPDPFFVGLSLGAADAALHQGQPEAAALILDKVVKRGGEGGQQGPGVEFYRGLAFRALGDKEKALGLFETAMNSRDRLYAMRGKKEWIDTALDLGKIDAKEAAKRMEEMRFAWIGDALELANLRRLGEIHALAGNYPQAFETMRRTISLFPDTPDAKEIAADMTRTFTDIFAKDGAAKMPPLEALGLYEQYRELTPPGAEGDLIIRKLAERLVEIDLLDRAAELLDHQVQYRLTGVEKAQVGTRLAGIRLLDGKPTDAVAALDASQVEGIPPELAEERRLLRARALSQSGKGLDAIQLLTGDQSGNANLLRVDIAMRDKQWPQAAQALGDVIGPPPAAGAALDAKTSGLVVQRAVALSLAQDNAGLEALRRDFGPLMEKTKDATAFRVLTRPEEAAGLADAATIRSRITEIDLFRSFLDNYRAKSADKPAAAATPPAQSAQNPS
ncbi:tetratricopeptide repeat protein [Niveispirillum sp. SYP-B3756]|uniref:tetratricopeptide repeat protein n=1 Tax=Niveispirillum sp. SYP-B3756 TaxID=2662178 RepID=UPI001292A329|nr:tetratricopeptide repeat protein [Niveispirillum sp. SYP-B3756]MQP65599.1 tetratricopeptide repeat protein [Niveispirillum sp. SYP-B3756]